MNEMEKMSPAHNPVKNAWVQLELIEPLKQRHAKGGTLSDYRSHVSYSEFKDALNQQQVVNEKNVREVPDRIVNQVSLQANYSGKTTFYSDVSDVLDKAFSLGMVDKNGQLLSGFNKTV